MEYIYIYIYLSGYDIPELVAYLVAYILIGDSFLTCMFYDNVLCSLFFDRAKVLPKL
jgi:hypothetical protein